MGFWNKLGKIALQAAPYVAAPFTGGASLLATGATQKLGQKWAESDAKKAAAKGLGPSKFDKILGGISAGAGMASSFMPGSALGKIGMLGKAGNTGKALTGWQGALSNVAKGASGKGGGGWQGALGNLAMSRVGGGGISTPPYIEESGGFGGGRGGGGWQETLRGVLDRSGPSNDGVPNLGNRIGIPGDAMNLGGDGRAIPRNPAEGRFGQQMLRQFGPVMGRQDQSNPNLALSIGAGRMEAIRNQPFRKGYDINTLGDDNTTVTTSRMPRIVPTGGNYDRERGRRNNARNR